MKDSLTFGENTLNLQRRNHWRIEAFITLSENKLVCYRAICFHLLCYFLYEKDFHCYLPIDALLFCIGK